MDALKRNTLLALSLLTTITTGCDEADVESGDGRDDAFLGAGKADGAIAEGSDEARAVLALVNTASFEVLDASAEVGLDVRAADGIYTRRVGDDGTPDTDDDVPFETLAQLDAVPWVGPSAFGKLREYALANGYGVVSCDDGAMLLDRCYTVRDEENVFHTPTNHPFLDHIPLERMSLHVASNGFTITGEQDLYESASWVTRAAWVAQDGDTWTRGAGAERSYAVDAMLRPDGSLRTVEIGQISGHSLTRLGLGSTSCSSRYIGQIGHAYGAFGPDGDARGFARISVGGGHYSLQVCEDGEFHEVTTTIVPNTQLGLRYTQAGAVQAIAIEGLWLRVYQRDAFGGWDRVVDYQLGGGSNTKVDILETPTGETHVYVAYRRTNGLAVDRVVLDDAGVLESADLLDGQGIDADAEFIQAGVDASGREYLAFDHAVGDWRHLVDLVVYDPSKGIERTEIFDATGVNYEFGFAVAPDGTIGLSSQPNNDTLDVRWMTPR